MRARKIKKAKYDELAARICTLNDDIVDRQIFISELIRFHDKAEWEQANHHISTTPLIQFGNRRFWRFVDFDTLVTALKAALEEKKALREELWEEQMKLLD